MFINNNIDIFDEEYSDPESIDYEYDSTPIYNRHNNTPHTTANDSNNILINTAYNSNALIPERIGLLLDRFSLNSPSNYTHKPAPPSPATQTLISNIPELTVDETFIAKHTHKSDTKHSECSICKITVQIGDNIKILQCGHYFHSKCIITWLNIHASCPLCRYTYNALHTSHTHSHSNTPTTNAEYRLQSLRRRRRSRRTLRTHTPSNPNSGNRTPNTDMVGAATQLMEAVTSILEMNEQKRVNNNTHFRRKKHKLTKTPHSSRKNTNTRNSMSDIALLSASATPKHYSNQSMPAVYNSCESDTEAQSNAHKKRISAIAIQKDLSKWNHKRRKSRLKETLPMSNTQFVSEFSNQTMIINGNISADEKESDRELCAFEDFSAMSHEELESVRQRCMGVMSKNECIVREIQKEKNKRIQNESVWKCGVCNVCPKAYMHLPCRHLGMCVKCAKGNQSDRCDVCGAQITQSIPINFGE